MKIIALRQPQGFRLNKTKNNTNSTKPLSTFVHVFQAVSQLEFAP